MPAPLTSRRRFKSHSAPSIVLILPSGHLFSHHGRSRGFVRCGCAIGFGARQVGVGPAAVDDLGVLADFLALHHRDAAEKKLADVRKDGSAAGSDLAGGGEAQEASEEFVDGDGGSEVLEAFEERSSEVGENVLVFGKCGVLGAEGDFRIGGGEAATRAVAKEVGASGVGSDLMLLRIRKQFDGGVRNGACGNLGHFGFPSGREGIPPGSLYDYQNKGVVRRAVCKSTKVWNLGFRAR
jgi:hypothetical protein